MVHAPHVHVSDVRVRVVLAVEQKQQIPILVAVVKCVAGVATSRTVVIGEGRDQTPVV